MRIPCHRQGNFEPGETLCEVQKIDLGVTLRRSENIFSFLQ